jgi:hypothetical protein
MARGTGASFSRAFGQKIETAEKTGIYASLI